MLQLLYILTLLFLGRCSMSYMNTVRKNESSVKFIGGESRQSLVERLGEPIASSKSQDIFRHRGRLDTNDFSRVTGGMTAFTLGLGEIFLFPYVLIDETVAMVADHFVWI